MSDPCGIIPSFHHSIQTSIKALNQYLAHLYQKNQSQLERTYKLLLQTPLPLPEFFPIGQWNRFKLTEVRHLTDQLALKLVRNGTKVSLTGSLMGFLKGL